MDGADERGALLWCIAVAEAVVVGAALAGQGAAVGDVAEADLRSQNLGLSLRSQPLLMATAAETVVGAMECCVRGEIGGQIGGEVGGEVGRGHGGILGGGEHSSRLPLGSGG
jgi:hypothetical protein